MAQDQDLDQLQDQFQDLFLDLFQDLLAVILVEIKPAVQTQAPTTKNKKRLLTEGLAYVKNTSKWKAAKNVCEKKGWQFQIWTEHHLRSLGCRV